MRSFVRSIVRSVVPVLDVAAEKGGDVDTTTTTTVCEHGRNGWMDANHHHGTASAAVGRAHLIIGSSHGGVCGCTVCCRREV